jgi:hypothetical protein
MILFVYILVLLHSVVYVGAEACTDIIQPDIQRNALERKSFKRDQNHDPLSQSLYPAGAWIEMREI